MEQAIKTNIKEYLDLNRTRKVAALDSVLLKEYRQDHSNGFTEDVVELDHVNYIQAQEKVASFFLDSAYKNNVLGFIKNNTFLEFSRLEGDNYIRIFIGKDLWFHFKDDVKKPDLLLLDELIEYFYTKHSGTTNSTRELPVNADAKLRSLLRFIGVLVWGAGFVYDATGGLGLFGVTVFLAPDVMVWLSKRVVYSDAFFAPNQRRFQLNIFNTHIYLIEGVPALVSATLTIFTFVASLVISIYIRLNN